MTDESDIYFTFLACSKFGGSFYSLLSDAGFAADYFNKLRLMRAVPALEKSYGPATRLHIETRYGKAA